MNCKGCEEKEAELRQVYRALMDLRSDALFWRRVAETVTERMTRLQLEEEARSAAPPH